MYTGVGFSPSNSNNLPIIVGAGDAISGSGSFNGFVMDAKVESYFTQGVNSSEVVYTVPEGKNLFIMQYCGDSSGELKIDGVKIFENYGNYIFYTGVGYTPAITLSHPIILGPGQQISLNGVINGYITPLKLFYRAVKSFISTILFLYSLVIFSQDCQINLTIPSGSYEVFDDNFELIDNDIVLLPILSDGDIAISSFQLNLEFNHQQLEINDELIGVINNSEFYSLNNISPSSFDVSSGGFYSSNTVQIDSVTSVFSIAYATSLPQPSVDVLMYIPLIFNELECSEIKFTNGYIDEQFVFPNQTFETLVSNQDVSNCNQDGLICIELTPDILGCTDSDACNYDINANLADDSCVYNGESCYVVVASDCCCCGLCMCVCENFLDSNYTCEFFITGEDSNNVVVQGQIENCECSLGQLEGCTDENACNYDELSIVDNDSCLYPNNGLIVMVTV